MIILSRSFKLRMLILHKSLIPHKFPAPTIPSLWICIPRISSLNIRQQTFLECSELNFKMIPLTSTCKTDLTKIVLICTSFHFKRAPSMSQQVTTINTLYNILQFILYLNGSVKDLLNTGVTNMIWEHIYQVVANLVVIISTCRHLMQG